ncbi:oxidoreductase, aldo/keto reductase family [Halanaerobium saccharolyticum subsp. saccharolyticum DSM 6643]|uniref:Oxidoreductase, aldo/keto reductase family n=1 Tax=Halanaerobium saccharolyticum subsp. saccharolyticum DSM 6643 TaxID=1293054 RepID=M5E059_9FIRM|nr:aldo/keto reductase [Halanaerobium saccharolyticum]CCU79075.1 oxidoreductase, aldo/keto reductase family [Halanaerobium saccharolyticum subsp. saccharolyticum DSM 6643]
MKKRRMGSTGLKVSEVGFGAWQLGNTKNWKGATDREAIKLVHKAIDLGCNFFDTAPNYAGGKSEELLGKALKGKREQVIISTKFGHFADGHTDYRPSLIKNSVENSLRKLQTDYLDSLLLHSPPHGIMRGEQNHYQILEELKQSGKIKSYGVSVDTSTEMKYVLENSDSEILEIFFNIFHQDTKDAFPLVKEKDVGLIVKVPLDSGWLTGKYDHNSEFSGIRERWSPQVIKRRADLVERVKEIKSESNSMVQEALEYILSYPEVSTVIPGVRNEKQLKENLSASDNITSERVKEYEKLYSENIEDNLLPW